MKISRSLAFLTTMAVALVWIVAAAGCSGNSATITSNQPPTHIVVTPGSTLAQPVASPNAGVPTRRLSPQAIEGGQAATTPAIPSGADPHNPTTGMTN